ncbi:MAG: YckD family protein [Peptococcaceae bacterium]|nr:YckD family protein [Peptococcaceae bacterium]
MKKKLFIVIGMVVALLIPTAAFAATSDTPAAQTIRGFCGIDTSNLTDQQKADLNTQFQKMVDLRKETINKMVADGAITKAQGDAAIQRMDDMVKYRQENGFTGRMGRGFGGGFGMRGGCPYYTAPTNQ